MTMAREYVAELASHPAQWDRGQSMAFTAVAHGSWNPDEPDD